MTRVRAFLELSRLKFLVGGFLGCLLGLAAAKSEHRVLAVAAYLQAQWTVTSFHLMTHYSNEYFDRVADRECTPGAFSGGSGVLVAGRLPPGAALGAALVCAAGGTAGLLVLLVTGHALAAGVALAIGLLAWSYSAPPLRLLSRGLGEPATALVVGGLVPLCAFAAQTGAIDGAALAAVAPSVGAMFVMMLAVEVPDVRADIRAAKRNLVVRWGPRLWPGLLGLEHCAASRIAALGVGLFILTTLAMSLLLWLRT